MPVYDFSEQVYFIIASTQEPFNKFAGLRWDEIDQSGDLIQSWIWFNNRWASSIKNFNATSVGTATGYFPLIANHKYLFKKINIFLKVNQNLTANAYVRVTTQIIKNLTINSISVETFNNQISNTSLIKSQSLNLFYTPTQNESIKFLVERIGITPTVEIGIDLSYQLVR